MKILMGRRRRIPFNAGRGSAVINNTGDNVVVNDPTANSYIIARFNAVALDNPTSAGTYTGFSSTATRIGAGENFGNDIDGISIQRAPDGSNVFVIPPSLQNPKFLVRDDPEAV